MALVMLGKQGRFQLVAEDGLSDECVKCGRAIKQFEVVLSETGRGDYYHRDCYIFPAFLHLDDSSLSIRTVYPENCRVVKKWIADHNKQLGIQVPAIKKGVATESSPASEALVFALQFLSAKEVLGLAGTAKSWYEAAWRDELWVPLLQGKKGKRPAREEYLRVHRSSCFLCHCKIQDDNLGLICPRTNRPLCRSCRQSEDMQLVRVETLCRALGVDVRNVRSELVENDYQVRGQSVIFWGKGVKKLVELRQKKREHLAHVLRYDDSLDEVMKVALNQPLRENLLKNAKARQLAKYFMELKSKGWLCKQVAQLDVTLSKRKKKKSK